MRMRCSTAAAPGVPIVSKATGEDFAQTASSILAALVQSVVRGASGSSFKGSSRTSSAFRKASGVTRRLVRTVIS